MEKFEEVDEVNDEEVEEVEVEYTTPGPQAAEEDISDEISLIMGEINKINSDKKFLELLDSNAEICEMVRSHNPNNKNYTWEEE